MVTAIVKDDQHQDIQPEWEAVDLIRHDRINMILWSTAIAAVFATMMAFTAVTVNMSVWKSYARLKNDNAYIRIRSLH